MRNGVWAQRPQVHTGKHLNALKPKRPQADEAAIRNGHKLERPQTGMATNLSSHKQEQAQPSDSVGKNCVLDSGFKLVKVPLSCSKQHSITSEHTHGTRTWKIFIKRRPLPCYTKGFVKH